MNILLQESKELVDAKGGDAWFDGDELAFVTPAISKLDSQVNEFLKVGPYQVITQASIFPSAIHRTVCRQFGRLYCLPTDRCFLQSS
jgi:hypothetical protein